MVSESVDKTSVEAYYGITYYGWFQLNPALSLVEVTVLLAVQSADALAVNCSTEETIPANGGFWLELIYLPL